MATKLLGVLSHRYFQVCTIYLLPLVYIRCSLSPWESLSLQIQEQHLRLAGPVPMCSVSSRAVRQQGMKGSNLAHGSSPSLCFNTYGAVVLLKALWQPTEFHSDVLKRIPPCPSPFPNLQWLSWVSRRKLQLLSTAPKTFQEPALSYLPDTFTPASLNCARHFMPPDL